MNKVFKLTLLVILVGAVSACGLMPSVDGVFVDQRETYKKAHELPPLELPPELKAGAIQDEYDGGTKKRDPKWDRECVVHNENKI